MIGFVYLKPAEQTCETNYWPATYFFKVNFYSTSWKWKIPIVYKLFAHNPDCGICWVHISANAPMVGYRWIVFRCKKLYNSTQFTLSGVYYCSNNFGKTQKIKKRTWDFATVVALWPSASVLLYKSNDATPTHSSGYFPNGPFILTKIILFEETHKTYLTLGLDSSDLSRSS